MRRLVSVRCAVDVIGLVDYSPPQAAPRSYEIDSALADCNAAVQIDILEQPARGIRHGARYRFERWQRGRTHAKSCTGFRSGTWMTIGSGHSVVERHATALQSAIATAEGQRTIREDGFGG